MHYKKQTNTMFHGGAGPVTNKAGESASSRKHFTLYFTVDGSYTLTLHHLKK
jgi:hypothetical protein